MSSEIPNNIPKWNLIGRIKQIREENMWQLKETAAAEITDSTVENERMICSTLSSINFMHSKLPKEEPGVEPGKSKHTVDYYMNVSKRICGYLVGHPASVSVDLRTLDMKIIVLSKMFKNAVEDGYPLMAEFSRICLVRAVTKVREMAYERESDKEALARYIKVADDLLDLYIETVGSAFEVDVMDKNIETQTVQLEKQNEEIVAALSAMFCEIKNNQTVNAAIVAIIKDEDDYTCSDLDRKVRSILVDLYIDSILFTVRSDILENTKNYANMARGQCDAMRAFMDANEIIGVDPDRLKQFDERVQQFFEVMSRHDTEYEKQAKILFNIEDCLNSLRELPESGILHVLQSKAAEEFKDYCTDRVAEEIGAEKDPESPTPAIKDPESPTPAIDQVKQKMEKIVGKEKLEKLIDSFAVTSDTIVRNE